MGSASVTTTTTTPTTVPDGAAHYVLLEQRRAVPSPEMTTRTLLDASYVASDNGSALLDFGGNVSGNSSFMLAPTFNEVSGEMHPCVCGDEVSVCAPVLVW